MITLNVSLKKLIKLEVDRKDILKMLGKKFKSSLDAAVAFCSTYRIRYTTFQNLETNNALKVVKNRGNYSVYILDKRKIDAVKGEY